MSPTIVLQDGQPVLTVGAAGGPKIISQVVLTIVRCLDYGSRSTWRSHSHVFARTSGNRTC